MKRWQGVILLGPTPSVAYTAFSDGEHRCQRAALVIRGAYAHAAISGIGSPVVRIETLADRVLHVLRSSDAHERCAEIFSVYR